jgi:hypothetical protein
LGREAFNRVPISAGLPILAVGFSSSHPTKQSDAANKLNAKPWYKLERLAKGFGAPTEVPR